MGKKEKVFIILTHHRMPHADPGKQTLTEKAEFVNAIKPRHFVSATVILDYINKTVVKQRQSEYSYGHYIEHIKKTYPQQMYELSQEYKV